MQINKINNYNPNFNAKFIHTDSLESVVKWAIEHNKFETLNQARKNIDKYYLLYRIKFELFKTVDGKPFAMFTRYIPKKNILFPKYENDYIESQPMIFQCYEKINPLKFGFDKIISLGKNVPNNHMYDRIIKRGGKPKNTK